MRSLVTAVIGAVEAIAIALAGLIAVAVPAALLWIISFSLAAEPAEVFGVVIAIWLLAHFVPLGFEISAQSAVALGLPAEAVTFEISLAPLGLTALTAALAVRAGLRFGAQGGRGVTGVLGGAIGLAGAALVMHLGSAQLVVAQAGGGQTEPATGDQGLAEEGLGDQTAALQSVLASTDTVPLWLATLIPALVYLIPAIAAFVTFAVRRQHPWWVSLRRQALRGFEGLGVRAAAIPARVAETVRLAVAAFAAYTVLSAVAVAAALLLGYADVIELAQRLQLDPLGSIVLFLVQLALMPVALIWAGAWITGVGFSVGEGSLVSPFESLLGPLPVLPMFGAIPAGWGALGVLAPLLLVLCGFGVGLLFSRRDELRRDRWAAVVSIPVVAAVLAGAGVAMLCLLASGSIGPDRLAKTGADAWAVGGFAALELGIGLLLGAVSGRIDYSRWREAVPTLDGVRTGVASLGAAGAASVRRLGAQDRETDAADPADAGARKGAFFRRSRHAQEPGDGGGDDDLDTADLSEMRAKTEDAAAADASEATEATEATEGLEASESLEASEDIEAPEDLAASEDNEAEAEAAEALLRAYSWDDDPAAESAESTDRQPQRRRSWFHSRKR